MVWGEQQVDHQQSVPEISRLHGIRFCMYHREQDSKVPHCRALCAGESYTYVTDTDPRTVSTHPRLDPIPSAACAGCSGYGSATVGRTLLTSLPSPPLLLCPCMDRTGPGWHPGRLARPSRWDGRSQVLPSIESWSGNASDQPADHGHGEARDGIVADGGEYQAPYDCDGAEDPYHLEQYDSRHRSACEWVGHRRYEG